MAIYVDDEPFHFVGSDLGSVLDAVAKRLGGQGRLVVEVSVGGRKLTGQTLFDARKDVVHQEEVRLYTADAKELALATLRDARESLREAQEKSAAAAEAFQRDQAGQAMTLLGQSMDVWHQLPAAILQSAQLLKINLDQGGEDLAVTPATKQLADALRRLREAVQASDASALADALGYEWPALAQRWERILVALVNRIELGPA